MMYKSRTCQKHYASDVELFILPSLIFAATFYELINEDDVVKSHFGCVDGLWKKLDIRGVVSETTIWQYMWYG